MKKNILLRNYMRLIKTFKKAKEESIKRDLKDF